MDRPATRPPTPTAAAGQWYKDRPAIAWQPQCVRLDYNSLPYQQEQEIENSPGYHSSTTKFKN